MPELLAALDAFLQVLTTEDTPTRVEEEARRWLRR
jgi:hypothetical protein